MIQGADAEARQLCARIPRDCLQDLNEHRLNVILDGKRITFRLARSLDKAFAGLSNCDRLIVGLRGNLVGGLGLLRLMSRLTPELIPIGCGVTRKAAERGIEKESLRRFGWIPSSKFAIPLAALRHAGRDGSVVLMTDGLGSKKFHGRIVLLVNEHAVSVGEMITAFTAEKTWLGLSEPKPPAGCSAALDSRLDTDIW